MGNLVRQRPATPGARLGRGKEEEKEKKMENLVRQRPATPGARLGRGKGEGERERRWRT